MYLLLGWQTASTSFLDPLSFAQSRCYSELNFPNQLQDTYYRASLIYNPAPLRHPAGRGMLFVIHPWMAPQWCCRPAAGRAGEMEPKLPGLCYNPSIYRQWRVCRGCRIYIYYIIINQQLNKQIEVIRGWICNCIM